MWVRQMRLDMNQRFRATEAPIVYPQGFPDFPINGLSFYPENIERVRISLLLGDNDETMVQAVLVSEPDNPHSKRGTAVAVYVKSFKVGYIPDSSSSLFFSLLKSSGGMARAEARFYYSSDGYSSCRLDVGFPPSWEAPIEGIEPEYLDGDGTFSFRMRSAKYPIDWSLIKTSKPELYLEVGGTYSDAGYLTMSDFGRSPCLDTDYAEVTAKPYASDEDLVNRLLASLGGKSKVEYKLTRTSETSHTVKLDLDVSRWRVAKKPSGQRSRESAATVFGMKSAPRKRRSKTSPWMKILFGKPRRKKSVWRGLFFGD